MVEFIFRADELKVLLELNRSAIEETALLCLSLLVEDHLLFFPRLTL